MIWEVLCVGIAICGRGRIHFLASCGGGESVFVCVCVVVLCVAKMCELLSLLLI